MRGLVSRKTKLVFAQLNTQNVKLKTRIRSSPRRFQHYLEKELIKVVFFIIEIVTMERKLLNLLLLVASGQA